MRKAFLEEICSLAKDDSRVWLLTGDLGYSVLEPFIQKYPDRFINMGVAEQNMAGVAAGLALEGKIVFIYSIANFPIMRCLEQIRNDICYHNLPVIIVAVGGGVAYGQAGYSHYACEDLAVLSPMPNITILAPGDPIETKLATRAIQDIKGPCYLRLGKGGEPNVHNRIPEFNVGKAIKVRDGCDLTMISTGAILNEVVNAANNLAPQFQAKVLSMPTLKPIDNSEILESALDTGTIITIEEHSSIGGLGDSVAHCICEQQNLGKVRFLSLSLGESVNKLIGTQQFIRQSLHLDSEGIADRVRKFLEIKKH